MTRKTAHSDTLTEADADPRAVRIKLPASTILKILAALFIAWATWQLGPYILLVSLSILIAVTLLPLVEWLEARGIKRALGHTIVIATLVALFCVSIALVIPTLLNQVEAASKRLPELRETILKPFPAGGVIRTSLESTFQAGEEKETNPVLQHLMAAGGAIFNALCQAAIVLVTAFYFMVDGPKIHQWLVAFFPRDTRAKLHATSDEMSQVIFAYVWGQAITSALVTIYSFAVLTFLHVPGALMLSIIAGVFDILPLLGFFLFTIPACLLALSVSPQTAMIVGALYLIYHAVENYFIVPNVYGKRLRLSTLTVLLGLLAGGILGGVPGALVALPLLAGYSAIERIWLTPYLHEGVAEKHEKQEDKEFGRKT